MPPMLKMRLASFPVRKAKSVWLWCTDPLGKGREGSVAGVLLLPAGSSLLPLGRGGSPGACRQP